MQRKVVFSGIQPTGNAHLGNYLGALRNWVSLQGEYDPVYCVVDLHAMTVPQEPKEFLADRLETAKVLLAVGIDPAQSLLFYQSQVPHHAELAWILGTMMPSGVLNRMTQFKDRLQSGATANLGLYSYPVLMAADILLHHAELVPVGEDQTQHLEVTRDLAARFNNRYGEEFPIPEPLIPERGARIMSLSEPTAKMSKSDANLQSTVRILDDPDAIRSKIGRAVTDSGTDVRYDWDEKPGVSNLIEILSLFTDTPVAAIEDDFGSGGYAKLKEAVAEAVVLGLAPVREAYLGLDEASVAEVMDAGADRARARTDPVIDGVRKRVGLA